MTTCEQIRDVLPAHLDGEDPDAAATARHLESCRECTDAVRHLRDDADRMREAFGDVIAGAPAPAAKRSKVAAQRWIVIAAAALLGLLLYQLLVVKAPSKRLQVAMAPLLDAPAFKATIAPDDELTVAADGRFLWEHTGNDDPRVQGGDRTETWSLGHQEPSASREVFNKRLSEAPDFRHHLIHWLVDGRLRELSDPRFQGTCYRERRTRDRRYVVESTGNTTWTKAIVAVHHRSWTIQIERPDKSWCTIELRTVDELDPWMFTPDAFTVPDKMSPELKKIRELGYISGGNVR